MITFKDLKSNSTIDVFTDIDFIPSIGETVDIHDKNNRVIQGVVQSINHEIEIFHDKNVQDIVINVY